MVLENIEGNLKEVYQQIVPGTMLHSFEIMNERRSNHDLRKLSFHTADGLIYFLDGSKGYAPKLAITKQRHNLILQNPEEAFDQLTKNGNYYPDTEQASEAIKAPGTEVFDLTKLKLPIYSSTLSYLSIPTFGGLNNEELRIAQCVYGHGTDFLENMKMLKEAGIKETVIYVYNPDYVRKFAAKGQFARAPWLGGFSGGSLFDAVDRNVNGNYRVLGVRRGSAATEAIGTTLENPEQRLLKAVTKELILPAARPYISGYDWETFSGRIPDQAPALGDVLLAAHKDHFVCEHSKPIFDQQMRDLYFPLPKKE